MPALTIPNGVSDLVSDIQGLMFASGSLYSARFGMVVFDIQVASPDGFQLNLVVFPLGPVTTLVAMFTLPMTSVNVWWVGTVCCFPHDCPMAPL